MGLFELFFGESCELIDAHFVGLIGFGVVLVDFFEIFLEDFESVGILFRGVPEDGGILVLPFLVEFSGCGC